METGPAAAEMRLSFKGSASDALKLPITHLVHASVGWRTQRRERRERRERKDSTVSAVCLSFTSMSCKDKDSNALCQTAAP